MAGSDPSLTPSDVRFITKLLDESDSSGDNAAFVGVVQQVKGRKEQERILIVNSYRVLTVKRGAIKTAVSKSLHLLELRRVELAEDASELTLEFTEMDLTIRCERNVDVARAVLSSLGSISRGFPPERRPALALPAGLLLPSTTSEGSGVAEGGSRDDVAESFTQTYRAFCDLFAVPPRQQLLAHVQDAVQSGERSLDLNECFEGVTNPSFGLNDLRALAGVLEYDTWFTGVVSESIGLSAEGAAIVFACLRSNSSLETMTLGAAGVGRASFEALASSMLSNRDSALRHLDVSLNYMAPGSATELGRGLLAMAHGLHSLTLDRCEANARSVAGILRSISNPRWASSLRVLNLTSNRLDREGSAALSDFLSGSFALTHLLLGSTNADCDTITLALLRNKVLSCSRLALLDLSKNKCGRYTAIHLGDIMHATTSLSCLVLVGMAGLGNKQALRDLFEPALRNPNPTFSFSADLSENDLSGSRGAAFCDLLATESASRLAALLLNKCMLGDDGVASLASALAASGQGLELLAVDTNVRTGLFSSADAAAAATAALIGAPDGGSSALKSLYFRGTKACCVKSAVVPVIRGLESAATSLVSLDISGHYAGDCCALTLGEVLAVNSTLRSLRFDRNLTSMAGFEAFLGGVRVNQVLVDLEIPIWDVQRIFSQKKKARSRALADVVGEIDAAVSANQDRYAQAADEERGSARGGQESKMVVDGDGAEVIRGACRDQRQCHSAGSPATATWDSPLRVGSPRIRGTGWSAVRSSFESSFLLEEAVLSAGAEPATVSGPGSLVGDGGGSTAASGNGSGADGADRNGRSTRAAEEEGQRDGKEDDDDDDDELGVSARMSLSLRQDGVSLARKRALIRKTNDSSMLHALTNPREGTSGRA